MKQICILLSVLGCAAVAPAPAVGHSFQLGVIVHLSGPEKAAGQQALDGLLLATRERDGHPDETSDGHLGGLDSHLRPIDAAALSNAEELLGEIGRMRLDIVTAALPAPELAALSAMLPEGGEAPAFCPPGRGPVPADRLDSAEAAGFRAAFRAEFGYDPSGAAAWGYNAGRAVDAAVRALDGVDDRAALARLCAAGS